MAVVLDRHRQRILAGPRWQGVVGNEKSVRLVRRLAQNVARTGESDAILLWGESGTGKSLCAALAAREAGACEAQVDEVSSGALDVGRIDSIIAESGYTSLYGTRAYIIEEVDTGSAAAIGRLLTWLERLPKRCIVVMTSNLEPGSLLPGAHGIAFHRRVTAIKFGKDGLQTRTVGGERVPGPAAELVRAVLTEEGLDGRPLEYYQGIVRKAETNIGLAIVLAYQEAMSEGD